MPREESRAAPPRHRRRSARPRGGAREPRAESAPARRPRRAPSARLRSRSLPAAVSPSAWRAPYWSPVAAARRPTGAAARFVLDPPPKEAGGASRPSAWPCPPTPRGGLRHRRGAATTSRCSPPRRLEGAPLRAWSPARTALSFPRRPMGRLFDSVGGRTPDLRKVSILGGPSVSSQGRSGSGGASWGPDDAIVFGQRDGPLRRVPAAGGEPKDLTQLAQGELSHRFPEFLPGGEAFSLPPSTVRREGRRDLTPSHFRPASGSMVCAAPPAALRGSSGHLIYAVGPTLSRSPSTREVSSHSAIRCRWGGRRATACGAATTPCPRAELWSFSRSGGGAGTSWSGSIGRGAKSRSGRRRATMSTRGCRPMEPGSHSTCAKERRTLDLGSRARGLDAVYVLAADRHHTGWSPDGRTIFLASRQESGGWDVVGRLADGTGEPMRSRGQGSYTYAPVPLLPTAPG